MCLYIVTHLKVSHFTASYTGLSVCHQVSSFVHLAKVLTVPVVRIVC